MPVEETIERLRAVENAIDDALDQPRSHTVTGSYVYESWTLEELNRERARLVRRLVRDCGGSRTISSGGR